MRNLIVAVCGMVLSGCVTVSVVPEETVINSGAAKAQSRLHTASFNFCNTAIERGWISQSPTLLDVAKVLVDGRETRDDSVPVEMPPGYVEAIMHGVAEGADVSLKIEEDVGEAQRILASVTHEAESLLASEVGRQRLSRTDLTSYERALVHAQKSRRSFVDAASRIDAHDTARLSTSAEQALMSYDIEIDRARLTADQLADLYTESERAAS